MMKEATERFLEHAHWLSNPIYEPIVTSLRMLADEIDVDPKPTLFTEYGRVHRYALKLVDGSAEEDPLDVLLGAS